MITEATIRRVFATPEGQRLQERLAVLLTTIDVRLSIERDRSPDGLYVLGAWHAEIGELAELLTLPRRVTGLATGTGH